MSLYCSIDDIHNESDVEQKFLWPLLTASGQASLGFSPSEVFTKAHIRNLTIEKGKAEKVYRPDYVIVLAGLPVVVVEAKHPNEDLAEALREARLYAAELNARHPPGVNPCCRIVVSNGRSVLSAPTDSTEVDFELAFTDVNQSSKAFAEFLERFSRASLNLYATSLRRKLSASVFARPTNMLGGQTVRNEEVGYNQFGSQLAFDFLHLFNPQSNQERSHIVRNAYVRSRRREHYVDEIDRVIRSAMPSAVPKATLIQDTSDPREMIRAFRQGTQLINRMFLLVGPVGSGKSTFVSYFHEMKLSPEIRSATQWVNVDLNLTPPGEPALKDWIVDQIIAKLKSSDPNTDFDDIDNLEKIFGIELRNLKKGPLALLESGSQKFNEAISDELRKLLNDPVRHAKALARHLTGDRGRLLVLVLDNCDKGDLDEQLHVFQAVRWIQSWLPCLVFLPIRDVTYLTCKDRPPLDTVIKDFVFRIETPPFTEVLRRRLQLVMDELRGSGGPSASGYTLESGMRVVYPATDLGYYLGAIFKSLYEHDRLLRRLIVGLAGKDIRRAMEIFLDFCRSGHIREKEYLKMRLKKGNYSLPFRTIARVLLRMNRRFYDGDNSHVRNLFQCEPSDPWPDNLVRLAILRHLREKFRVHGPRGIRGFHQCGKVISELVPLGHDADCVRREILYLLKARCVVAEHQRADTLDDDELICLAPAGFAHLDMFRNVDYVAACSEDTWIADPQLAGVIAERVGRHGMRFHYERETARRNASGFLGYLLRRQEQEVARPEEYLTGTTKSSISEIQVLVKSFEEKFAEERKKDSWPQVEEKFRLGAVYTGVVDGVAEYGAFVTLAHGVTGLLHISKLPVEVSLEDFHKGMSVQVEILAVNVERKRIALGLVPADT